MENKVNNLDEIKELMFEFLSHYDYKSFLFKANVSSMFAFYVFLQKGNLEVSPEEYGERLDRFIRDFSEYANRGQA